MKYFFLVSTFALGSPGGGTWEDDELVSGATRTEAFTNALTLVAKQGFAFTTKIEICNRKGEIPQ